MAYGFGATKGTSAADRLVSAYTPGAGITTLFIAAKRNAGGGGGFGRYFDAATSAATPYYLAHDEVNGRVIFQTQWNTATNWQWNAAPSAAAWHTLAIEYDNSSTSNTPKLYIDGVLQGAPGTTTNVPPSGSWVGPGGPVWFGNRPYDQARNYDGELYQAAIWTSALSVQQHADLASGVSPKNIGSPVLYTPLDTDAVSLIGSNLTVSGAVVTASPSGYGKGVAAGGTGTATGSATGGAATGTSGANGTVPAGTGTSTGSATGGSATGTSGPNGIVPAAEGVSTGSASGGTATGGGSSFLVKTDAIWTWYNDARAVSYNGNTYFGSVNSTGDVSITKRNETTGASSSFVLHSALSVDDHCVPTIVIRPDGRISASYAVSQGDRVYYRVSTNAEDVSAWGTESYILGPTSALAYANPRYLSGPGKLVTFSRAVIDTNTREHFYAVSADGGLTFGATRYFFYAGTGKKPYGISVVKGTDEVHFLMTDQHPDQGQTSLYHFYGKWDVTDNDFRWYKTDGTRIMTALPFSTADATLIYDGSSVRCWNWGIDFGADGYPRVLYTTYPNNNGTDIRMNYSRWNGSAWTAKVEIAAVGQYLYAAEDKYTGGACFDSRNPDHVYISVPVSGVREIQEWETTNSGATWAKRRDITSGTGAAIINGRPYSPRNRSDNLAVLWWSGTYSSWSSYNTNLYGAPASFSDGSATAPGGAGISTGSGSGGAATGTSGNSATAPAGTGASTGSGSGGSPSASSTAPAGTGTGPGSGSGGTAAGGASVNATAPSGEGVGFGSGQGGNPLAAGATVLGSRRRSPYANTQRRRNVQ